MTRDLARLGLVVGPATIATFAFGSVSLYLLVVWAAVTLVYGCDWRAL